MAFLVRPFPFSALAGAGGPRFVMARGVLAALMAALPAGCNGDHGDTVRVAVVGKGGNADDLAGKLARASVNDGLVGLDADGKVVPALAEALAVMAVTLALASNSKLPEVKFS